VGGGGIVDSRDSSDRHSEDRASILLTSPIHPLPPPAVQQATTATPSSQSRYALEINGPSSTLPFARTAGAHGITYQSSDHTQSN
jgi:hypothetical protein